MGIQTLNQVPPGRFPWRGLLLGTVLIPPMALLGVYAYVVVQATLWTQTALLRGPVFVLFLPVGLNLLLKRLARRWALREEELLLIYSMSTVATAVGGIGFCQFLVPTLGAAAYYATPENRWAEFHRDIPPWFWPQEPQTINDLYRGYSTLYTPDHLRDLAVPLATWTVFLALLLHVTLSLSLLVRRQWIERERLSFPLVHLPLAMAKGGGEAAFWGNRLMWLGFAVAGLIQCLNSLNYLYPVVPAIPVKPIGKLRLTDAFVSRPWNALNPIYLAFYPFMIGVGFLLTLDISASCWGFYWIAKLENLFCAAVGLRDEGVSATAARAPYLTEQGVGAFVGLAVLVLWRGRRDFIAALARLLQPLAGRAGGGKMENGEWRMESRSPGAGARSNFQFPISNLQSPSPRVGSEAAGPTGFAGGGLLVSLAALLAFCGVAGLPAWIAGAWLALYFLFTVTCTRISVETGSGWTMAPWMDPHQVVFAAVGSEALTRRQLTVFAWLQPFDLDFRDSVMPHQLSGLRLLQGTPSDGWPVVVALMVAAGVGILAGLWAHLHVYFLYGLASAKVRSWPTSMGQVPFQNLAAWLTVPREADPTGLAAAAAGATVVAALFWLRQRVLWWPLHPVGYALANTGSMDYMWCPFLVAWMCKFLLLRYGGMKLYRQMLPLFLGLILGDYVIALLWALYGAATGQQMYLSFPH